MAAIPPTGPAGSPAWLRPTAKPSPLDQAGAIGEIMTGVALLWTAQFARLASVAVEMNYRTLRQPAVATWLAERGETAVAAVIRAPEWNAEVGLVLERRALGVLVEALFGGDGDAAGEPGAAALSSIERQIVEEFGRQIAHALQEGLAPHLPARLEFDRLLAKPDFATGGRSDATPALVTLTITAPGGAGEIDLLLPPSLLDSIAEAVAVEAVEAPVEHDPRWTRQLGDEVGRAMTRLRAVIDMPPMSLGAILDLSPGQILPLPMGAGGKVKLTCGSNDLFRCDLGKLAGHYTLRIDEGAAIAPDTARSLPFDLAIVP